MKILVTGGFGNIGAAVVDECLSRGHSVTVFEVVNRRTAKLARKYGKRVRPVFGDLRNADDVARAVTGQDAVIHLAAILPPASDAHPDFCMAVNVGGTINLVRAMQASAPDAVLVSVSSASVMGPTQKQTPPVSPAAPLAPTDTYSRSKIEAEALVAGSGLRYCILRLAAVMPTVLNYSSLFSMAKLIFDMPLDARCEIVIDLDAAYALVAAAENLSGTGEIAGKKGFVAGGRTQGCRIRTRELVAGTFAPMGLSLPDESLFSPDPDSYYLDWYDTDEIQSILHYQRHSADEWQTLMRNRYRALRMLLTLFRGIVMKWIEKQSPRYAKRKGCK